MVCIGITPGMPVNGQGMPCKDAYAVIDHCHEGAFPVIAVCPTGEAAKEYIAAREKEDKRKGNSCSYGISAIAIGLDLATREAGGDATQGMQEGRGHGESEKHCNRE